jgi:hypothetical protein
MESVSNPLAFFMGSRHEGTNKRKKTDDAERSDDRGDFTEGQLVLPDTDNDTEGAEYQEGASIEQTDVAQALPPSTDLEVLHRIFRVAGDNKLKLRDSRLKQSNKGDYVKRLTALFLLAHELEGREEVPRTDLNAALSDAKIYDSNARTWMRETDHLERDGDSVRLALPGRDFAQKVLQEYTDPNIETKWSVGSKSRTRLTKKRAGVATEDEEATIEKNSHGRRPQGTSYTAKVTALFDAGFFTEGQTGKDVKEELQRQGFKFELRRISEALLNLTKKKKLTRNQNDSGEWVYENS